MLPARQTMRHGRLNSAPVGCRKRPAVWACSGLLTHALGKAARFAFVWVSAARVEFYFYVVRAAVRSTWLGQSIMRSHSSFSDTAFTVVHVGYNALTPELTSDYDERSSLNGYRMVFDQRHIERDYFCNRVGLAIR